MTEDEIQTLKRCKQQIQDSLDESCPILEKLDIDAIPGTTPFAEMNVRDKIILIGWVIKTFDK